MQLFDPPLAECPTCGAIALEAVIETTPTTCTSCAATAHGAGASSWAMSTAWRRTCVTDVRIGNSVRRCTTPTTRRSA